MARVLMVRPVDHHPGRNLTFVRISLPVLFLSVFVMFGIHCGEDSGQPDVSSSEKLAYIAKTDSACKLMLTTTAGGDGQSFLEWPGNAERFSFSNDGRYLSLILDGTPPKELNQKSAEPRLLFVSTDGARAFLTFGPGSSTFSPDSTRVAYVSIPDNGMNEMGTIDLESGETKILARGKALINPTWMNDKTLIYTKLNDSETLTNLKGGIVYRQEIDSTVATQLTPSDRSFSTYKAPVSFVTDRIVLTEKGPLYNLWSLDIASGRLRQITNNTLYQFRAGYLPGSDNILFEEQVSPKEADTSEICVISDNGTGFRMLTSNYFFDGLNSFSLESGKIAYQQRTDKNKTSIWTVNQDGSGETLIAGSDTLWLGDPVFVPVPTWQAANPLQMTIGETGLNDPIVVTVKNTSNDSVESALRAFTASDLSLTPSGDGPAPVQKNQETTTAPELEWRLVLKPGESTQIRVSAAIQPAADAAVASSVLFTLAVPGTAPRMHWQAID